MKLFIGVRNMRIEIIRNNNARKFDQASRLHRNCLPFRRHNGKRHYQKQFDLCIEAFKNGHNFLVEAALDKTTPIDRLRADFVNLDTGEIIEIPLNENQKSLDRKKTIWEKHGFKMAIFNEENQTSNKHRIDI